MAVLMAGVPRLWAACIRLVGVGVGVGGMESIGIIGMGAAAGAGAGALRGVGVRVGVSREAEGRGKGKLGIGHGEGDWLGAGWDARGPKWGDLVYGCARRGNSMIARFMRRPLRYNFPTSRLNEGFAKEIVKHFFCWKGRTN